MKNEKAVNCLVQRSTINMSPWDKETEPVIRHIAWSNQLEGPIEHMQYQVCSTPGYIADYVEQALHLGTKQHIIEAYLKWESFRQSKQIVISRIDQHAEIIITINAPSWYDKGKSFMI